MADSKNNESGSETEADLTGTEPDSEESTKTAESKKSGESNFDLTEKPTFDFTEKSWRTDLTLVVEGQKLYVSKTILSLASPVFNTMFLSDFKDSSSEEFELPGKKLNDVTEFLQCIYPNTFTRITHDNALIVLPLVEEYQVLHLKPWCENALLDRVNEETQLEDLFHLLRVSCMYGLLELREKCVSLAAEKSQDDLDIAIGKLPLPSDAAKGIYEKANKKLRINIADLQGLIEEMSDEAKESAKKLKETNETLLEELSLLKQYLSTDIRKGKNLKLDDESNWQEKQVILFIDTKNVGSTKEIVVWDVPLKILASQIIRAGDEWLAIDIRSPKMKIVCSFKVYVILVNRQPKGQNYVAFFEERLATSQRMRMNLKSIDDVVDLKNGFARDGKIGLIVQMYMSEPNKMLKS